MWLSVCVFKRVKVRLCIGACLFLVMFVIVREKENRKAVCMCQVCLYCVLKTNEWEGVCVCVRVGGRPTL